MKLTKGLLAAMVFANMAKGADITSTVEASKASPIKISSSVRAENALSVSQSGLKRASESTNILEASMGASSGKLSGSYGVGMQQVGGAEAKHTKSELGLFYSAYAGDNLSITGLGILNLPSTMGPGLRRLGVDATVSNQLSSPVGALTNYGGLTVWGVQAKRSVNVIGTESASAEQKAVLGITDDNTVNRENSALRMEYIVGTQLVPSMAKKWAVALLATMRRQYNPVYSLTNSNDGLTVDHLGSETRYSYGELDITYNPTEKMSVYANTQLNITTAKNKVFLKRDMSEANKNLALTLGVYAKLM